MTGQPICANRRAAGHVARYQAFPVLVVIGILTCAMLTGRYTRFSAASNDVDRLITTFRSPVQRQNGDSGQINPCGRVQITFALDAGDRLILSSLDLNARRHQVLISGIERTSSQPKSAADIRSSAVDWAIIEPGSRLPGIGGPPIGGNNTEEDVPGYRSGDDLVPDTAEPTPRSINSTTERPFCLPHFLSGNRLSAAASHCSNRFQTCRQVAISDSVLLYATDTELSARTVHSLVEMIEDAILPAVSDQVGPIADVDCNDRLSVVVCELCEHSMETEVPLLGCVRAADFLSEGPFRGDIIYLDFRLLNSDALPAVITHEMTHAATFSQLRKRREEGHDIDRLPCWFNEAIAHSCEYRSYPASPNLADRISSYLHRPGRWPLVSPSGLRPDIAGRGPMRAAGLFYVEFLRREATIPELIDRELMMRRLQERPESEQFAASFRQWTVWMSDQQQADQFPLTIRDLPHASTINRVTIRGTAATWWQSRHPGNFTVSADTECALQMTIVKAD
ncbi:MAG: hypothetical protein ABGZ35_10015 [Planctomycetaceae bacterium]